MKYDMVKPCDQCPFLKKLNFPTRRLMEFCTTEFPCHKTATLDEDDEDGEGYVANENSRQCAGALIYMEKRGHSSQMSRIAERLGLYDPSKLDRDSFKAVR